MYRICFVYIYPLNGFRELNSFEEPCLTRVTTITSFATHVGRGAYIVIHRQTVSLYHNSNTYIYIYIYSCSSYYSSKFTGIFEFPKCLFFKRYKLNKMYVFISLTCLKYEFIGWKVYMMTSYLLLIPFFTNCI